MKANAGRPLEFDPERALDRATDVFWSRGYEHTSMQDLLEAMDISKSSLYLAFGDKRSLFRRCLERYATKVASSLRDRLTQAHTGREFIESFFRDVVVEARRKAPPRGCLVMNTAGEFAQSVPEIARDIAESIGSLRGVLEDAVRRAQDEGDIDVDRDPGVFASYLVSSMSGLKTMAKAGVDRRTLDGIIDVVLKTLA